MLRIGWEPSEGSLRPRHLPPTLPPPRCARPRQTLPRWSATRSAGKAGGLPTRSRRVAFALLLLAQLATTPAWAWNPFKSAENAAGDAIKSGGKKLGQGLGEGAVEALQPALVSTIGTASRAAGSLVADVDTRLTHQVDHVGGVASKLVSDSLDKVDHILEKRLLQIETTGDGLVKKLDSAVDRNLHTADKILKDRSAQLGAIVSDSIQQADQALEQRIAQLDEDVALRLGNVDVIATKQRLGLEETALHTGALVGLLVFVIIVLRTLWREFAVVQLRLADKRGVRRTLAYLGGFAKPILLQVAAAGFAVLVIYVLYDRLPLGARAQAAELAAMHRREMTASLARFDFSRVRFHASQLEVLVPEQGAYYQAMAGKAALLRDLVARPALLATDQGVSQIVERVQALERQLGDRADPDVLTMKALVLWQIGTSKRDEHAAASYCARALRLAGAQFALAPLARHYIRAFLHAPYLAPDTPYGRDTESLVDLRVLAALPMENQVGFPLESVLVLDRLMGKLDREVTPSYLDMLNAHAEVLRLLPSPTSTTSPTSRRHKRGQSALAAGDSPDLLQARQRRNDAASRVLAAWRQFDNGLDDVPGLSGKSAVLAIFRMNDASYTRAAWFVQQPQQNALAPLLADVTDIPLKAKLAPPRIGWEKQYGALIARELHSVAELQEASRFEAFERQNRDFEQAYVAQLLAAPGPDKDTQRRAAAVLAAKLGLYINAPDRRGRIPVAASLTTKEDSMDPATVQALAEAMQARGLRTL
jgi:hypothetical protein